MKPQKYSSMKQPKNNFDLYFKNRMYAASIFKLFPPE